MAATYSTRARERSLTCNNAISTPSWVSSCEARRACGRVRPADLSHKRSTEGSPVYVKPIILESRFIRCEWSNIWWAACFQKVESMALVQMRALLHDADTGLHSSESPGLYCTTSCRRLLLGRGFRPSQFTASIPRYVEIRLEISPSARCWAPSLLLRSVLDQTGDLLLYRTSIQSYVGNAQQIVQRRMTSAHCAQSHLSDPQLFPVQTRSGRRPLAQSLALHGS
jgi:hypothetical protein